MSLKNKLSRLKPHLSIDTQNQKSVLRKKTIEVPYRADWEKENVYPYYFDENYCLIREVSYPLTSRHGYYMFEDFLKAVQLWNSNHVHHPISATGHKAEDLFFFDTETTGLGGGTGNTIFLLGYASIKGENLVLRQHILPNPGAEVPLYQSFLEMVDYKTLVTYNGKSFDWPQVKTRHTLVRDHVPKLPPFGHFDLYHASRRLWKHRLDKLKLSVVEKEVLGFERINDIPGYLAPIIYFDFLETNRPDGMLGILKHNELDILSLVTLYTHLTFQLNGEDPMQTRSESFEVGRWYASLGEKNEAKKVLNKLASGKDSTSFQAKLALAYQYKKSREWEKALCLFRETADNGDSELCLEASIEAAKLLEHKQKNINQAICYCQKAMNVMKQSELRELKQNLLPELVKRIERLNRKSRKFPG